MSSASELYLLWRLRGHWGALRRLRTHMVSAASLARRRRRLLLQSTAASGEKKDEHRVTTHISDTALDKLRPAPNLHQIVNDGEGSVYSTKDPSGRPSQVWRHDHALHTHTMMLEERNVSCSLDVAVTRDGEYITINSNSRTSSEVHFVKSRDPSHDLKLVLKRQPRVEYYVDHAHNRFYILTNMGLDGEYKLMVADELDPGKWSIFYKPKDGFVLQDLEIFSDCLILYGSRELVPIVIVIDPTDGNELYELSDSSSCWIEKANISFESKTVPVWLSSPTELPHCILIAGGSGRQLSVTQADSEPRTLGKGSYQINRTQAINEMDGTRVPITLSYSEEKLKKDNSNPLLVHVYGCYGESIPLSYRPEHEQLVSLGWVLAFCHVRGGGERGRGWYHDGQGRRKWKSFEDLHACVMHLHQSLPLSRPSLTAMTGRSAGGQTAAMFCNLWPHLLQAALLQVPFVDVRATLMNLSLHSSLMDFEEFGIEPGSMNREDEEFLRTVCPYSTLKPQDYPSFYITASRLDDIVPFEGVQKYAEKLKQCVEAYRRQGGRRKSGGPMERGTVILRELRNQGHFDNQDISKQCYESALSIAFLHKALSLDLTLDQTN